MKFWQLAVFGLLAFAMVAQAEDGEGAAEPEPGNAEAGAESVAEPEPEAEPEATPEPEAEPNNTEAIDHAAMGHDMDHDHDHGHDHGHDDHDHGHDDMDHDDHHKMEHDDHMEHKTDAGGEAPPAAESNTDNKDKENGCGAIQFSVALLVPALMALMAH